MTDFKDIKAFAFDVDGVLTDGGLLADEQGGLYRTFNSKDGFGVRMAEMNGYPVAIITGGKSVSVRARGASMGIPAEDVYLASRSKIADLDDFCKRHNLERKDVMFFGDDVPDAEALRESGVGVCPADSSEEAIACCDYVSERKGGNAVVREYIEKVLKAQGKWVFDESVYKTKKY